MDDLISRQDAIDALMPIYKSASLRNRNVFSTARKCMVTIEELPSAQSDVHDRNVGEWIDYIYCSECGWVNQVESGFIGTVKGFNFCPNCGADMRERKEE